MARKKAIEKDEIMEKLILAMDAPRGHDHVPTKETRFRVASCAAARWPHQEIALALGITMEQLASTYLDELERGPYVLQSILTHKAFDLALEGKVSMMKYVLDKLKLFPDPQVEPERISPADAEIVSEGISAEKFSGGIDKNTASKLLESRTIN